MKANKFIQHAFSKIADIKVCINITVRFTIISTIKKLFLTQQKLY